jgi:F420-0:gamma-glutamyl ligase-like protein
MSRYKVQAITTTYWKPKEDYMQKIADSIEGKVADEDFVVISEKAISTALGHIVDESKFKPSANAKFIAKFWMRIVWGYLLGPLCHFREGMIHRLRAYPVDEGSRHKQVVLTFSGISQVLMFGSEGGIDGSNLPYSYASLPLNDSDKIAQAIRERVLQKLHKKVYVIIADTDKTYSFRNLHFTPRPKPICGIYSFGGVFTYVIGRMLKLERKATPIAVAGAIVSIEQALEVVDVANRARGSGAGKTVWDMADKFKTQLTGVTWEMLEIVRHKPIVIVRRKR